MDTSILLSSGLISFATALAATSGGEIIKPVTQVLDNWFYTKFGSKIDFERKKKELKNEHNLDLYKSELKNKDIPDLYELEIEKERLIGVFKKEIVEYLLEISPENIQVPDQQIVALIMENIHLYLSIDELRNKFARLLASSADKSHSDDIHPLFVETIKTLSPKEALFLESLGQMPFTIADNISIENIPNEKEIPHIFPIEEEQTHTNFNLKLDKTAVGIPIVVHYEGFKGLLNRGFYVENESLLPVSFLEKQNIINVKKVEEISNFPSSKIQDYIEMMENLVEENQTVLDIREKIESKFKEHTRVQHNFCLIELSSYGHKFKKIILDS